MNTVCLVGRLTRDPETVYTGEGVCVTKFGLAVDRINKNEQGERETDFLNCVAFRQTAEFVSKYLGKGRLVAIRGSLQSRKYTTPEGQPRTAVEIVAAQVDAVGPRPDGPAATPVPGPPGKAAPAPGSDPFDDPWAEQ